MKFTPLTVLFAIALAASAPLGAQQAGGQAAPQQQVEVSDTDLELFAEAQEQIIAIQQDYSQRLQGAEDPERASKLQQEANEKMVSAVEESGLDVETFNTIAVAVQNDPELQQRLQDQR